MPVASCEARGYMNRSYQTGRYRSGQTGQTVNLLALRLRWFESSPAQIFLSGCKHALSSAQQRTGRKPKSAERADSTAPICEKVSYLVAASSLATVAPAPVSAPVTTAATAAAGCAR